MYAKILLACNYYSQTNKLLSIIKSSMSQLNRTGITCISHVPHQACSAQIGSTSVTEHMAPSPLRAAQQPLPTYIQVSTSRNRPYQWSVERVGFTYLPIPTNTHNFPSKHNVHRSLQAVVQKGKHDSE